MSRAWSLWSLEEPLPFQNWDFFFSPLQTFLSLIVIFCSKHSSSRELIAVFIHTQHRPWSRILNQTLPSHTCTFTLAFGCKSEPFPSLLSQSVQSGTALPAELKVRCPAKPLSTFSEHRPTVKPTALTHGTGSEINTDKWKKLPKANQ